MDEREAWEYLRKYYDEPEALASFELLAKYEPGAVVNYIGMRSSLFQEPPEGALPVRYKELVLIGMECIARKVNPPPIFHARKAIAAGASVQEIAEVVSLSLMIGGMLTYQEAGKFVLAEAERAFEELAREGNPE